MIMDLENSGMRTTAIKRQFEAFENEARTSILVREGACACEGASEGTSTGASEGAICTPTHTHTHHTGHTKIGWRCPRLDKGQVKASMRKDRSARLWKQRRRVTKLLTPPQATEDATRALVDKICGLWGPLD